MARPKLERPLTEDEIHVRLRDRFKAPEFSYLPHVRNGTGYARRVVRTADALAMCLYPSRGVELHGIEIKSARSDWLAEKEDPDKAEEIARFVDRWWLVVGREDIVQPGELPAGWGLLVPSGDGLRVKVDAPKLEATPMDRLMLAAILRRASECVVPKAEIEAELKAAHDRGEKFGREMERSEHHRAAFELARLKESVAEFEKASGVEITSWNGGHIGAAVEFVRLGGLDAQVQQLRTVMETAQQVATMLGQALTRLQVEKSAAENNEREAAR